MGGIFWVFSLYRPSPNLHHHHHHILLRLRYPPPSIPPLIHQQASSSLSTLSYLPLLLPLPLRPRPHPLSRRRRPNQPPHPRNKRPHRRLPQLIPLPYPFRPTTPHLTRRRRHRPRQICTPARTTLCVIFIPRPGGYVILIMASIGAVSGGGILMPRESPAKTACSSSG